MMTPHVFIVYLFTKHYTDEKAPALPMLSPWKETANRRDPPVTSPSIRDLSIIYQLFPP